MNALSLTDLVVPVDVLVLLFIYSYHWTLRGKENFITQSTEHQKHQSRANQQMRAKMATLEHNADEGHG